MGSSISEMLSDPARLAALQRVRAVAQAASAAFDRLAELAAVALDAPIGMVNFVGADQHYLVGVHGLTRPLVSDRTRCLEAGFCQYAMAHDGALLIDDVRVHEETARRWAYLDAGLVSYAGIPLRDRDGYPIGTLCVLDAHPRRWRDRDRRALEALARSVMSEVALHQDTNRRERLLEAFRAAPVAVAVTGGPEHIVEYLNLAFREAFGDRPTGVPGREAFPELESQGVFALMDQVFATGEAVRAQDRPVALDLDGDGVAEDRFFTFSYSPIRAADEVPSGLLVVAADVTGQVLARREVERHATRQSALARATAAVNRSLDPQAELVALARAVVPALADVCTVHMLDRPARLGEPPRLPLVTTRVAMAHVGPPAPLTPGPRAGLRWAGGDVVTEAIRVGGPVRTGFGPAALPSWVDPAYGAVLAAGGAHTVVSVPVSANGVVHAVITFVGFRDRLPFSDDDMAALGQVAAQANVAIGQGLAYQRTRESALALQRAMLTAPSAPAGLRLAALYRPAGADAEVGGDWYDAFELPDGDLTVVIGDVAGHDMAAAATMGQLRSMLRALVLESAESPAEVLSALDRLAVRLDVTSFTTLVLGRLRREGPEWVLRWANAGHPPPVLLGPEGRSTLLTDGAGLVLGVQADVRRCDAETKLAPGAAVLFYTDGLVERRGRVPDDEITGRIAAVGPVDVDELCDGLLAAAPTHDDVALLAVEVLRTS